MTKSTNKPKSADTMTPEQRKLAREFTQILNFELFGVSTKRSASTRRSTKTVRRPAKP